MSYDITRTAQPTATSNLSSSLQAHQTLQRHTSPQYTPPADGRISDYEIPRSNPMHKDLQNTFDPGFKDAKEGRDAAELYRREKKGVVVSAVEDGVDKVKSGVETVKSGVEGAVEKVKDGMDEVKRGIKSKL
ncbi:hypothetical protein BC832DRAFT_548784 [Gaertneriomyces semiglobifer]|nr:hypothetical protein BC832DRAFT_548784 [Gaertneriomyces semiglobifer]